MENLWVKRRHWLMGSILTALWLAACVSRPAFSVAWRHDFHDEFSSLALQDNLIFAGNRKGIYALQADTGEERWQMPAPRRGIGTLFDNSSLDNQARMYFGMRLDPHLYSLDTHSGELVWEYTTDAYVVAPPQVIDRRLYFATADGLLTSLALDRQEILWQQNVHFFSGRSLLATAETIYVAGGLDGKTSALDAASGQILWSFQSGFHGASNLLLVGDYLYFGSGDNTLYALDANLGQVRWRFEAPNFVHGLTYAAGTVFAQYNNVLIALDAVSGRQKWRFRAAEHLSGSPLWLDGVIYTASQDGHLYALNASLGREMWSISLNGDALTSLLAGEDMLFLGDTDGVLYALSRETQKGDNR